MRRLTILEGSSLISADILARYAADAACEVEGVRGLVERPRPRHRGVRVTEATPGLSVELRLAVEWGTSIATVGESVQRRVAAYLGRMAGADPVTVAVIVDEVAPPPRTGSSR